jgi:hypothetical protein
MTDMIPDPHPHEQQLEQMKSMGPGLSELAYRCCEIEDAMRRGDITVQERNYLLAEVRDVEAAEKLAGDENAMRLAAEVITLAISAFA